MFNLIGKVVWVTGSSTGIGRAIAVKFAECGAKVVVHGNANKVEAEKTLKEVSSKGADSLLVLGDVTDRSQVDRMVVEIKEEFGQIDVLINNAGTMVKRAKVEEIEQDTLEKIFAINFTSVVQVTQAVLPLMKDRKKGVIVNMTSIAARNGGGGGAVIYAAAKGAVSTLTRGLAKELAEDGIRVNGIAPGVIATPFHERYSTPELVEKMVAAAPLGRAGQAEEIAGAALYLASDLSSYVTGEIIEINGGVLMD
ncbi:SDR family NAD(P)-dependent oxidoreductase [Planomicrobium sp. CPCC 101110]|uniref:SDR family NAD(P)-dependent oxidoreductase n=1 Tax=Planomicrobium sp. CPCC 101110 TaxID=2599619 RepID=UPI0011B7F2AB|nr:glucose 1-dehydrogenase [Planomicrobium sp. CPCC 101110]TWT27762.1 glucose 1-dehydrogenase [Planomicrobium sp. CPCC 101110]